MKGKVLGLLAAGLLAGPMTVSAAVRYEFTAYTSVPQASSGGQGISGGFVVETSGFITSDTTFSTADLLSCSYIDVATSDPLTCGSQQFLTPFTLFFGTHDVIQVSLTPTGFISPFYYFTSGAFGAAGVYDTVQLGAEQSGRLVVTDLNMQVPEPGTLALLGLGLAGLGLTRRRKAD